MKKQLLFLTLGMLVVVGCSKKNRELHDDPINPSLTGTWSGSMKINGVTSPVTLVLRQNGINIEGTYTSDGTSVPLSNAGSVQGVTTGAAFTFNMIATAPSCVSNIRAGGENAGAELSFNLTGSDCNNTGLVGQARMTKNG